MSFLLQGLQENGSAQGYFDGNLLTLRKQLDITSKWNSGGMIYDGWPQWPILDWRSLILKWVKQSVYQRLSPHLAMFSPVLPYFCLSDCSSSYYWCCTLTNLGITRSQPALDKGAPRQATTSPTNGPSSAGIGTVPPHLHVCSRQRPALANDCIRGTHRIGVPPHQISAAGSSLEQKSQVQRKFHVTVVWKHLLNEVRNLT